MNTGLFSSPSPASIPAKKLLNVGLNGVAYSEYPRNLGTAGGGIFEGELQLACAIEANSLRLGYNGYCSSSPDHPKTGDANNIQIRVMDGYQVSAILKRKDTAKEVHYAVTCQGGISIPVGDTDSYNLVSGVARDGHGNKLRGVITISDPITHPAMPSTAKFTHRSWVPASGGSADTFCGIAQQYGLKTRGEGNFVGPIVTVSHWRGEDQTMIDQETCELHIPNIILAVPQDVAQESAIIIGDSNVVGFAGGIGGTPVDSRNFEWQRSILRGSGAMTMAMQKIGVPCMAFGQGGAMLANVAKSFDGDTYKDRSKGFFDSDRAGVLDYWLQFHTEAIIWAGVNDWSTNWMTTSNGNVAFMELLTAFAWQLRMKGMRRVWVLTTLPRVTRPGGMDAQNTTYISNPSPANRTAYINAQTNSEDSTLRAQRILANNAIMTAVPTFDDGSPLWRGININSIVCATNAGGEEVFDGGMISGDGVHLTFDNGTGATPMYGATAVPVLGQRRIANTLCPTSFRKDSAFAI